MVFNDRSGCILDVSHVVIIHKIDTPEGNKGIQFILIQGISVTRFYRDEYERENVYQEGVSILKQFHKNKDEFSDFMQRHTREGLEFQKKKCIEEDRGW